MSFLSIKAVRLDSKECVQVKTPEPKDSEDLADISSSLNDKIKGKNGKENTEEQKKLKIENGEKIWRLPRKGQTRLKSLMMSPMATNSPTESSSFPKLIAIQKDNRKINKIEKEVLPIKRSSSAPGCSSYVHARVTKHKFRLPCIPDLRPLSITEDRPIKTLVVEGKKLVSAGEGVSTPDSNDNSNDLPKSDSKVISENSSDIQTKEVREERTDDDIDGGKGRCHGDFYEDSLPSMKKPEYRVKTAYASSSRMFNTYLQSRFGKSVYESGEKKTGAGVGKKYQVYWAPVLIKKKMLSNRTVEANCTQESRAEANSVEKDDSKERNVHFGGNIHTIGGNMLRQQDKEWSSVKVNIF